MLSPRDGKGNGLSANWEGPVAGVLKKRQSLHRSLNDQHRRNAELAREMEQAQAMTSLGLASAMIAHEMNNLLTPLGSYAQLALQNVNDQALVRKALERTVSNTERAARIIEIMLQMAQGRPGEKGRHCLRAIVEDALACTVRDFGKDRIEVRIEIDPGLQVWAEPVSLQQAMMNLILNARQAMLGRGGVLTVSAQHDAGNTRIEVADTGCGIPAECLPRLFGPFFTTRTVSTEQGRRGTGLGLAMVKRVIEDHEGMISVRSQPGEGAAFTVTLPTPPGCAAGDPGDE